eukprot:15472019-Alexandrium_andersonii.AAC.1
MHECQGRVVSEDMEVEEAEDTMESDIKAMLRDSSEGADCREGGGDQGWGWLAGLLHHPGGG